MKIRFEHCLTHPATITNLPGAALNGRTRRLILGQSLDNYETKHVHPLWHAWLNHRGEPPTPEQVEAYDQQRAAVAQRVLELDQHAANATRAFPVSSSSATVAGATATALNQSTAAAATGESHANMGSAQAVANAVRVRSKQAPIERAPWQRGDNDASAATAAATDEAPTPPSAEATQFASTVLQSAEYREADAKKL